MTSSSITATQQNTRLNQIDLAASTASDAPAEQLDRNQASREWLRLQHEQSTFSLADDRLATEMQLQRFTGQPRFAALRDHLRDESGDAQRSERSASMAAAMQVFSPEEWEQWRGLLSRLDELDVLLHQARQRQESFDAPETSGDLPSAACNDVRQSSSTFFGSLVSPTFTLKSVPTYWARISMGLREGFDGPVHTVNEVREFLMPLVERERFCVALTATELVYRTGTEPCVEVALMNYPRFPCEPDQLRANALRIAEALLLRFRQYRLTVMFPEETLLVDSGLESHFEP